jgi:hypothetical protein
MPLPPQQQPYGGKIDWKFKLIINIF